MITHAAKQRRIVLLLMPWKSTQKENGIYRKLETQMIAQAVLLLSNLPSELVGEAIEAKRLYDAVMLLYPYRMMVVGLQLMSSQDHTAGWRYGSWGVCFTYGLWFGVNGLVSAGKTFECSSCIRNACDFLLSKQLACGGWGESYLSCQNKGIILEHCSVVLKADTMWASFDERHWHNSLRFEPREHSFMYQGNN